MRTCLGLLLAVAVAGAGAFGPDRTPEGDHDDHVIAFGEASQIAEVATQALRSFSAVEALFAIRRTSDLVRSPGDGACCECVRETAEHVTDGAVQHIQDFCATTTCPLAQHICEVIEERFNVTLGILVEKIRPAELAFGYCLGQGSCTGPADEVAFNTSNAHFPASNMVMMHEVATRVIDSMGDLEMATARQGPPPMPAMPPADEAGPSHANTDGPPPPPPPPPSPPSPPPFPPSPAACGFCIGAISHHIMRGVGKGIQDLCEHVPANCTVGTAACEWMAENREFVFGFLLAKVEPAKFALGACIANAQCPHPFGPPPPPGPPGPGPAPQPPQPPQPEPQPGPEHSDRRGHGRRGERSD